MTLSLFGSLHSTSLAANYGLKMMNTAGSNNMMSSASASASGNNAQSPGLKTYFKTPEGKYKLQYEKTHPSGLLHYGHGKTVTQVTLAHLKEKPVQTQSQSSSSLGVSSGVRSAAARFLGGGNGSRALSFVGGNGGSKSVSGASSRIGSLGASSSNNVVGNSNFDGKGTYLVFNVGDAIFISDLNSQDKDPIKSIHFGNSNPVCHAFDPDAKDGHDLLIGLNTGDVYSVSLRQQLQEVGKKLVAAQHYNKDGSINTSRCTCIAWVPNGDGTFIVGHADGNMYVYEKSKDGSGDPSFPVIKDQTQFSVAHARYSKNPVARWHICQGSINSVAFSTDGVYMATVGRDGIVNIWVSGVAFDSYWSAPNSDGSGENVVYRFGSVGQDTRLLLWDLEMDELVVPVRRPTGGSPTFSTGSQSSHWDGACPVGTLRPAPSIRDVPKLSQLVAHRIHTEPLSGLIFTQESVLTISREGHIKIWMRPGFAESQPSNSDSLLSTSLKEKTSISGKVIGSSYKQ
ncbi:Transducin/WD40 repeat-like superfamily protein [Forsythia ovata]|uniref:Transducin/WD40 repeat-like superfamily protein n=1 Tax=Forsythia ovata TaxID=205694 RepID=A0ABD1TNS4_9LAMI